MQLKLINCSVSFGANTVLKKVNFDITDKQTVAVIGRNGCGKTTLLRLICGDILPDRNDSADKTEIIKSNIKSIGYLKQTAFDDDTVKMIDEVRKVYSDIIELKNKIDKLSRQLETNNDADLINEYSALQDYYYTLGGHYFEKEYETVIKKFGFTEEDKQKPLSDFSGGQRTKIAFIKLLLSKPDILLLDEPTNHLDINAVEWLEEYLKNYPKSVVIVSHDRMFLDKITDVVYEIENGTTYKYNGNYTKFAEQKKILRDKQLKDYLAQKQEISRLETLVEKFKNKPTKAAMARSKLKAIEHMDILDLPEKADTRTFHADFQPISESFRNVLTVKDLVIGYDTPLSTINLTVEKGDRIGIIGGNGLGKSTFLKTIVGKIPKISGSYKLGTNVTVGYFDQQITHSNNSLSVLDEFRKDFPQLTDTEARTALGAFLFTNDDVFKSVSSLSGGERVRLVLCKILRKRPNFLILDEPTNHMDLIGKETLEAILQEYSGTVLFVSHDRYFIKKIATSLLSFENGGTEYYKYGYEQYLNNKKSINTDIIKKETTVKEKKTFTTPLKEKARKERQISKIEKEIAESETRLSELHKLLETDEIISDYLKLVEIQGNIEKEEKLQTELMNKWEEFMQ